MKRWFVCFIFFLLLFTSTAFASETASSTNQETEGIIVETNLVEPRYDYLAYMSVSVDIDANGNLTYGGSARSAYRYVRITLTLQRSTNGLFWDDLESTIKKAYDNVSAAGGRTVEEGDFFYRVKIITDVFDSNNNIIETATGYSSEERY